MVLELDLLDALSLLAGCGNLSNLRYLDSWQRIHLAHALERIPAHAAALSEWNEALVYFARDPPQETAESARERLIRTLSLVDGDLG